MSDHITVVCMVVVFIFRGVICEYVLGFGFLMLLLDCYCDNASIGRGTDLWALVDDDDNGLD